MFQLQTRYNDSHLNMRILVIVLLTASLSLASLEEEYSEDTSRCVETARAKHLDNPNVGLDHFVNCLLAQLQQVKQPSQTCNGFSMVEHSLQ